MKNKQPANANPKILAFIQGTSIQRIVLFIPQFKTRWMKGMKEIPEAFYDTKKKLWSLPYSTSVVQVLEQTFGKDILFAFKIGEQLGNHKTDR